MNSFPLLGFILQPNDYCYIFLDKENLQSDYSSTSNPQFLDRYISSKLNEQSVNFGIGGYLEKRNIYSNSSNFEAERNIHLGIDIWAKKETTIYSPLDSTIHSFKNNNLPYDYGGTIILEHCINNQTFHTLYGHLSLDSLNDLFIGKEIKQGTPFCKIGDWNDNGGWPPHLHFQKIMDMQDFVGDYPGVCKKTDLSFYKLNCPNPKGLTGIK